jgi:tripartite-type tricarboxylate transporter receptor subunit TctC
VDRLNQAVLDALDLPEVRTRLEQEGIDAERMDPLAFANFVKDENARWLPIVRSSISKPD